MREAALAELCTERAPARLGLGSGLTPSFDDACVGVMAVYRALGKPPPFVIADEPETTDVSARYLRLAREGFFGQPLLDLADALSGEKDLKDCLRNMLEIGATSGADMICGIRAALQASRRGDGEDNQR